MSGNNLLLVPINYLENIYLIELKIKKLLIFESLYGSIVIALQKYTPLKLKTFVFLAAILMLVIFIFCYILMLSCIQYLNQSYYVTNINIIDEIEKEKKKRIFNRKNKNNKNEYDKVIESRNKRNMIDASKKHMFEKFKILNITKNDYELKNLNNNCIYIPMYRHSLILRIICYLTVFPIIFIKNLVYYLAKI